MPSDLQLLLVNPDPAMCAAWEAEFRDHESVRVIEGAFDDLAEHDCFVTAANSFGMMTAGIDAAVVAFHGQELMDRLQHRILSEFLGEQPVGTAIIEATGTPGYPYVAHVPTMRIPKAIDGTDAVYVATWTALVAVYRHNLNIQPPIRTVAMPAMGAGFGNVPYRRGGPPDGNRLRQFLAPTEPPRLGRGHRAPPPGLLRRRPKGHQLSQERAAEEPAFISG